CPCNQPRTPLSFPAMKKFTYVWVACVFLTFAGCGQRETEPASAAPASAAPAPTASAGTSSLSSGIDAANFEKAVRVQDDFYKYVNGTWLAKTEIPADKSSYGAFTQLADGAENDLRELIEAAAKTSGTAGSVEQQVGDLYNSFMDEARS